MKLVPQRLRQSTDAAAPPSGSASRCNDSARSPYPSLISSLFLNRSSSASRLTNRSSRPRSRGAGLNCRHRGDLLGRCSGNGFRLLQSTLMSPPRLSSATRSVSDRIDSRLPSTIHVRSLPPRLNLFLLRWVFASSPLNLFSCCDTGVNWMRCRYQERHSKQEMHRRTSAMNTNNCRQMSDRRVASSNTGNIRMDTRCERKEYSLVNSVSEMMGNNPIFAVATGLGFALDVLTALDVLNHDERGALRFHYVLIAVLCEWVSGTVSPADDVSAATWVEMATISSCGLPRPARASRLSQRWQGGEALKE